MKAAIFCRPGEPGVLEYVDVPAPTARAGDVLIRVEAISIEGGDLERRRHATHPAVPTAQGYVAAGTILEVGDRVRGFVVGQRVATFDWQGSHAELRAVSADTVFAVPPGLAPEVAAAALVPFATAELALDLGQVGADTVVLVQGATEGVGAAAVQLAHGRGARAIGTGRHAASLTSLVRHGLELGVLSGPEATQLIWAQSGERGVDVILDLVGGTDDLRSGVDAA